MSTEIAWVVLVIAGLFEVLWAYSLKESQGLSRLGPSAIFFVGLLASMGLLAVSLKSIPLSIAYPVWTGIGAVGSVAVGVLAFGEPVSALKLLFVGLIVVGILGLRTIP